MNEIHKQNNQNDFTKLDEKDDFYTTLIDIKNEIRHFRNHFKNKTVYCNCDDPNTSKFFEYFKTNFRFLNLKKVISTYYDTEGLALKSEMVIDPCVEIHTEELVGNGDFRNEECIELLKESDIVVSSPPYSLLKEYINQLIYYNKKFLIIGNVEAILFEEIFTLIKSNKMWLGCENNIKYFLNKNNNKVFYIPSYWYTNLNHKKRNEELFLSKKYTPTKYLKYDYIDAINVDKVQDIPIDYYGLMGVPISFLKNWNPKHFKIIDGIYQYAILDVLNINGFLKKNTFCATSINGIPNNFRILIQKL